MRWNSTSCLDLRAFVHNHEQFSELDFKKKFPKKAACIVVPVALSRSFESAHHKLHIPRPEVTFWTSGGGLFISYVEEKQKNLCYFFPRAR